VSSGQASFALPAVVTMEEGARVMRGVEAALAAATGGLRLDASALDELDTAAIALLLHAQRLARRRGIELQVDGLPTKLLDLARLYGVESLLGSAAATAAAAST